MRRSAIPVPTPLASASERGSGTTVLVAGSVGTGKTTLLADWARELERRGDLVGWASLDREDNDPQVMAMTLLGAVRAAAPGTVAELDDETAPSRVGTAFVTRLLELAGAAAEDMWLVLDDLHLVRDPRCVELVEMVVRWAPTHLHVVIGTRAEPDLHLARLRLQERLVEVRERDLRFSLDDTRELLSRHDLTLEDHQVRHLQELTEGWAAGVALAAVSLARGRDADVFLREFARSNRAMSGYLVEEVLASLDESTREFLLSTVRPRGPHRGSGGRGHRPGRRGRAARVPLRGQRHGDRRPGGDADLPLPRAPAQLPQRDARGQERARCP